MNRPLGLVVLLALVIGGVGTASVLTGGTAPTEAAAITCKWYDEATQQIRYSSEWNGSTATATKTATPRVRDGEYTGWRTPVPTATPTSTPSPTATPIPWCQNADSN